MPLCETILKTGKRKGEMCGRMNCRLHKTIALIAQTPLKEKRVPKASTNRASIMANFQPHKETSVSVSDLVSAYIDSVEDPSIQLLRDTTVVRWIMGDLSFLPPIVQKNKTSDEKQYKVLEDQWGQMTMKTRRPDLKLDKQWTNTFGEYVCKEIYTLLGKTVSKPMKKNHLQPDLEVDDAILEVKTGTFHTSGTAGEKILGTPFKYAELPSVYMKPVKIICIGGAERICASSYGNLAGEHCTPQKKLFLDFYRQQGFEYIGASDILRGMIAEK